ncbi:MAG: globin domain-containing protein [Gammaproteobacteria bacterium]|nr:globin domain-containing protein [Gammaproteobacteria bacterium]
MTPEEIKMVKASWAKVVPISDQAAELFYGRLFEVYPEVKPLFKTDDMKEQGRKLMAMIGTAVNGLDNLEPLLGAVKDLGKRHVDYGVKDEDYDKVAECLIWTLNQGLGDEFTDELEAAWVKTYTAVADVMKDGAST